MAIACANVLVQPWRETGQAPGIDWGRAAFATLADGTRSPTPGSSRRAARDLAKCQRRVSRRTQGSQRRRKAVGGLAKAQQTVRRQRQDVHHKTALHLVRANAVIDHEAVRVANLVRNHQLAKSIAHAGGSACRTLLACKAACAGKQVVAGDPACTRQRCSGGGGVLHQGLSVRWHACPQCGTSLPSDHNAARNIPWRGQRLRGLAGVPAALNREPARL